MEVQGEERRGRRERKEGNLRGKLERRRMEERGKEGGMKRE